MSPSMGRKKDSIAYQGLPVSCTGRSRMTSPEVGSASALSGAASVFTPTMERVLSGSPRSRRARYSAISSGLPYTRCPWPMSTSSGREASV